MHDLAALRAHPGHPGEEAPRDELAASRSRSRASARAASASTATSTWSGRAASRGSTVRGRGAIEDGWLHGRGAVDMKGAVAAALHALPARARRAGARPDRRAARASPREEDGGLGTFAALERDAAFDACLIPEPTAFDVVCAQAGALTFRGTVRGRAAHAAMRLEGRSALDRYIEVHLALQAHERALNARRRASRDAGARAALPAQRRPHRGRRRGRARCPTGSPSRAASASASARALADAPRGVRGRLDDGESRPSRSSGPAASSPPARRPTRTIRGCAPWRPRCAPSAAPRRLAGVPYGADMRLFCARGIPTVMVGTAGPRARPRRRRARARRRARRRRADHRPRRAARRRPDPVEARPACVAAACLGRVELALDERRARGPRSRGPRGRRRRSRRAPRASASRRPRAA